MKVESEKPEAVRERERELYFNEISKDRGYVAFIRDG